MKLDLTFEYHTVKVPIPTGYFFLIFIITNSNTHVMLLKHLFFYVDVSRTGAES